MGEMTKHSFVGTPENVDQAAPVRAVIHPARWHARRQVHQHVTRRGTPTTSKATATATATAGRIEQLLNRRPSPPPSESWTFDQPALPPRSQSIEHVIYVDAGTRTAIYITHDRLSK